MVTLEANVTGNKLLDLTQNCFLIKHVLKPTRYDNILDLVLSSEENMVDELFVLEHLANSDHNIITWKTTCETVINKNFRKTFVFHKADYDKINEHFSNYKWEDIFQNRNANECWMKFLEIAKEVLELYVPTRGQRKRKVPPWMTKKVLRIRKYKSVLSKKYHNRGSYNDLCGYKRVLNRATSEYKKAKYSFEKTSK